jgi:hypothetical protein
MAKLNPPLSCCGNGLLGVGKSKIILTLHFQEVIGVCAVLRAVDSQHLFWEMTGAKEP